MSGACAQCVSSNDIVKCARIPISGYNILVRGRNGDYTDASWRFIRYYFINGEFTPGHYFSGTSATKTKAENGSTYVTCYISSPLILKLSLLGDEFDLSNPYEICAQGIASAVQREMSDISKLPDDVCPDGFYTVPYDVSCGVGRVEVSNIPQCDTDMSGEFCLIGGDVAAPCAAGVTTLRTGTGLTIPLWAEKATTPALHVRYNGTVCYINLEPGNAPNSINVEYGGVVYHTVN